jgi:hypothetical protein
MLDSVPSTEPCSSPSLSDSSGSKSFRAMPPPIPDLFISVELLEILELLEAWASQQRLPAETEARAMSPIGEFSRFCLL